MTCSSSALRARALNVRRRAPGCPAATGGCGGDGGRQDEELGGLLGGAGSDRNARHARHAPIDVLAAASDANALARALSAPHHLTAARLGAHRFRGTSRLRVTAQGEDVEALDDETSIDFAAEVLHVATLKRIEHVRAVPVRPALLGDLARHIAGGGISEGPRLFPITRQRVFQIMRKAAGAAALPIDRAHPHTLRHSFAVACVLARVPVLVLAEWLGHASIEATLVYTKVLCEDSRRYLGDVDFG
jgi:hypothetical protein